jgi:hypothetical protein
MAKRNATEATIRNVRASHKRDKAQNVDIDALEARVTAIEKVLPTLARTKRAIAEAGK